MTFNQLNEEEGGEVEAWKEKYVDLKKFQLLFSNGVLVPHERWNS